MTEISLAPPDKSSMTNDAEMWAERARTFAITDAASCTKASYLLLSIKNLRSSIQRFFEPHIEAAMEVKRKADAARKALVDEKDRMEAGLVVAEAEVKRKLLAYEQEEERRRLAEEARLQADAQRHAEAVTLAVAASLELDAVRTGDAEMLDEAHAILAQPVDAPVVLVKPTTLKIQGLTYRDNWKSHPQIDVKQLAAAVGSGQAPITFLQPNLTAINQFARATQGAQPVAGVRFFNDRTIAARA